MLRRPSVSPGIVREEGCSSTAFGAPVPNSPRAWNNLADRGSRGEFGTAPRRCREPSTHQDEL